MLRSVETVMAVLIATALTAAVGLIEPSLVEPALAEPLRPPKPYTPVAITPPPAFADESFVAFRQEFAAVAKGRIYAELARLIVPDGFFWERDFGNGFQASKPAVDNLAAAVRLEHDGGVGWSTLAAFATEVSAAPLPSFPGVICAPQNPQFDAIDFDRLLNQSYTDEPDWAYPRADKTIIRAAAATNAATVETLGLNFVRLLARADPTNSLPKSAPSIDRSAWTPVVAPSGKTGFVAPGALVSFTTERLCYGKDASGRWRIAGFVGTGN